MRLPLLPDFFLGPWRVRPSLNQLDRGQTTIRLAPKFMQVLCCLAERPGEVVSRADLLEAVWADSVVVEEVLTRAVYKLRQALEDDSHQPRFIETIPKTGYRLIAPIRWAEDEATPRAQPAHRKRLGMGILAAASIALLIGFWTRPPAPHPPPETRLLTSYSGEEMEPALSPDGQHVAFTRFKGSPGDSVDLYSLALNTGVLHRVTASADPDMAPAWSPDGQWLGFIRRTTTGQGLYRVRAAGGPVEKLDDLACDCWPQVHWSPDGQWLAFADRAAPDGPQALYLLNPTTATRLRLTNPPTGAHDDFPTFSPDGRTVAFLRAQGGVRDLYRINTTGEKERRLTNGRFDLRGLDWSPDGSRLLFASRGNLWQIDAEGGPVEWLTTGSLHLSQPATARKTNRLVYAQTVYDTNIQRYTLHDTTAAPTPLIASSHIDRAPQIAPDGQHIAFISDRSGACEVWMSGQDGTSPTQLATLGGPCLNTTILRWSPDSQHLTFAADYGGPNRLYTLHIPDARLTEVATGSLKAHLPSWSHDGRAIYFTSNHSGAWEVWRVSAAGGAPVQITTDGGYAVQAAPGGQWLYYTRAGEAGLWQHPLDGGAPTQVIDALEVDDLTNWKITATGLYYLDRAAAPVLMQWSPTTQRSTRIATLPSSFVTCSQLDVSPDGSWLLYVEVAYAGSDVVLVDHFR